MAGTITNSKRDRSIAQRLTISLVVTVSIVSIITVGPIYYNEAQKNRRELEQKADDIINYQVGVLAKPLWDLDQQATQIVGKIISQNELVAELTIKDYFGRVAYSFISPDLTGSIHRSARVLHEGNYVGEVRVALTSQFRQSKNRSLLNSFLLTICIILSALFIVSGLLVRTFLRNPLDRLNEMVSAYASGKYDTDTHQPYIEFQPFTRVLDQMGKKIVNQIKDLATAEEKYRSIFENAIEGIFQSSPEGRYFSVNPAMAELLGYSSPKELLTSITDIAQQIYHSTEERKRFNRLLEEQGCVLEFETDMCRKDGSVISVSVSARAIRDKRGDILYYEGYLVDVTRRKMAIEALNQTKEQLALLLESLPIVAFTARAGNGFGITYVSSSIREITGFSPEQFTADPSFWEEQISSDDSPRILTELPSLLETGRFRSEYRFRAADGSFRWFDDTRRLVLLPDGGSSHVAGTWRDITEEKHLRSEANYRLQQVIMADKLASLGQVVAGVAHEMCNPNSFIAYNAPILEETWQILATPLEDFDSRNPGWRYRSLSLQELRQDMEEIIQHIKTGSDRINRIVSHLKDFVRTEEGLPPRPLQINEVIESALTIVGAQARASVATIVKDLAPDLPVVLGYYQKLEQVVTNLIVNALHAVPEKTGGMLSIRSRSLPRREAVMFQVEDNGIGMERETMERIFEPFFTLRRDNGGTGLGLSVSYNLIKEHGGVICVLSRPSRGSRFTVILPISPQTKLDLRPAVLCLHADRNFTQDLAAYFSETGETLLHTINEPAESMEVLAEHPEVDILFLDLETVLQDGPQLFVRLRQTYPLLTFIAYARKAGMLKEYDELIGQAEHCIQAPFVASQLKTIIFQTSRQKL